MQLIVYTQSERVDNELRSTSKIEFCRETKGFNFFGKTNLTSSNYGLTLWNTDVVSSGKM